MWHTGEDAAGQRRFAGGLALCLTLSFAFLLVRTEPRISDELTTVGGTVRFPRSIRSQSARSQSSQSSHSQRARCQPKPSSTNHPCDSSNEISGASRPYEFLRCRGLL